MGSEEKRYALLIDSDNVSAKYIDTIFDEFGGPWYGNGAKNLWGLGAKCQWMESSNFASKFHRSDPAVRLYPG